MALSFQSTSNQRQQQQHQHTQSYQSAASIFATIEENLVKKVLHIIGVQQNDKNIMTATICNVIDTVTANTYNMLNKTVNGLADTINNNNNIMLNKINDIIGKNNKNIMNHINNSMNKMDKKIDGIKTKIMSEEEEKESLVEILLNDIDIIKSKINLYESNNNKCDEINVIKSSINEQSGIMEETFNKKFKEIGNLIKCKMENLNKMKLNMNKLDKMENNLDDKIYQSQNKMLNKLKEDINNKLKIMENNFVDKIKLNQSANINKLDEMNLNILNQVNGIKNLKNSLNENINNKLKKIEKNLGGKTYPSSNKMFKKLDEIQNEIKQSFNINKLDEINLNILNIKNEFETSALSNSVALQRLNKKMDNIKFGDSSLIKDKKLNANNNNKKITITKPSILLSSKATQTSTYRGIGTSKDDELNIKKVTSSTDNNVVELYIDRDYQIILGITTKCVVGKIKKIVINNNNKKNEIKNNYEIIINHFGKVYRFFIKEPKKRINIKDLVGYIEKYNFMEHPYGAMYVNGSEIPGFLLVSQLYNMK